MTIRVPEPGASMEVASPCPTSIHFSMPAAPIFRFIVRTDFRSASMLRIGAGAGREWAFSSSRTRMKSCS